MSYSSESRDLEGMLQSHTDDSFIPKLASNACYLCKKKGIPVAETKAICYSLLGRCNLVPDWNLGDFVLDICGNVEVASMAQSLHDVHRGAAVTIGPRVTVLVDVLKEAWGVDRETGPGGVAGITTFW